MNKEKNRSDRLSQILWAVSGVALGAASVISFCAPGASLLQVMPWLGGAMLLSGASNIVVYRCRYQNKEGGRWILADGLTAALLSFFLLFNQMTPAAVIPLFFGVWELFSGVLRLMEALEQREQRLRGWQWFYTVGFIEILSGVAALLKPVEEALTMHVVIGIVILIQAIAFCHKAFVVPRLLNRTKG